MKLLFFVSGALAFSATRPLLSYSTTTNQDCNLASVLLIAVPNLHATDLIHLPSTNAAFESAAKSVKHLYLNPRVVSEELRITEFINHCGGELVSPGQEQGSAGKTVTMQVVEGLQSDQIDRGVHSLRREFLTKLGKLDNQKTNS